MADDPANDACEARLVGQNKLYRELWLVLERHRSEFHITRIDTIGCLEALKMRQHDRYMMEDAEQDDGEDWKQKA